VQRCTCGGKIAGKQAGSDLAYACSVRRARRGRPHAPQWKLGEPASHSKRQTSSDSAARSRSTSASCSGAAWLHDGRPRRASRSSKSACGAGPAQRLGPRAGAGSLLSHPQPVQPNVCRPGGRRAVFRFSRTAEIMCGPPKVAILGRWLARGAQHACWCTPAQVRRPCSTQQRRLSGTDTSIPPDSIKALRQCSHALPAWPASGGSRAVSWLRLTAHRPGERARAAIMQSLSPSLSAYSHSLRLRSRTVLRCSLARTSALCFLRCVGTSRKVSDLRTLLRLSAASAELRATGTSTSEPLSAALVSHSGWHLSAIDGLSVARHAGSFRPQPPLPLRLWRRRGCFSDSLGARRYSCCGALPLAQHREWQASCCSCTTRVCKEVN